MSKRVNTEFLPNVDELIHETEALIEEDRAFNERHGDTAWAVATSHRFKAVALLPKLLAVLRARRERAEPGDATRKIIEAIVGGVMRTVRTDLGRDIYETDDWWIDFAADRVLKNLAAQPDGKLSAEELETLTDLKGQDLGRVCFQLVDNGLLHCPDGPQGDWQVSMLGRMVAGLGVRIVSLEDQLAEVEGA